MVVGACQQLHTLGDNEGQGSLLCCSPRGRKESDTTLQLNKNNSMLAIDVLAEMVFSWGGRLSSALRAGGSSLSLCGKPNNDPRHCPVSPGGRKQKSFLLENIDIHIHPLYVFQICT